MSTNTHWSLSNPTIFILFISLSLYLLWTILSLLIGLIVSNLNWIPGSGIPDSVILFLKFDSSIKGFPFILLSNSFNILFIILQE